MNWWWRSNRYKSTKEDINSKCRWIYNKCNCIRIDLYNIKIVTNNTKINYHRLSHNPLIYNQASSLYNPTAYKSSKMSIHYNTTNTYN